MTAFLQSQLDFILFFYGLSFILLGAVCAGVARSHGREAAWGALALFGFLHGVKEWLDIGALMFGDGPLFDGLRTWLMIGSFMCLSEFPRRQAAEFGLKLPAIWVYPPLALGLAYCELRFGLNVANDLARYVLGTGGAWGAALVFVLHGRRASEVGRTLCLLTAGGFLAYGVATGLIGRPASFWPAQVINQERLLALTGVPIQLVRGLLASWLALMLWAVGDQLLKSEVKSTRYTAHRRRQFAWTVLTMIGVLASGWTLTQVLGGIHQRNFAQRADGEIGLLTGRIASETTALDQMARSLAGAPPTPSFLGAGTAKTRADARTMLDLTVSASGAGRGYLIDRSGRLVMRAPANAAAPPGPMLSSAIRASASGLGPAFILGGPGAGPDYYAGYPVRGPGGGVLGVAVLGKSLDSLRADLRLFNAPFYLVDPAGVIALTNRPSASLRRLWLAEGGTPAASGAGSLLDGPVADAVWTTVRGSRVYLRRRYLADGRWSVVTITPLVRMEPRRGQGIVVTLLATVISLIYLSGRDRSVRDSIYRDRQMELQRLAQDLTFKATTDPLTGLFNRLKLDEALAAEIARAERFHTPFSLILFDIDHFKVINDSHGHPVGDQVLVELAQLVSSRIRVVDVLARWGGEEFIVLARGTTGSMARHLAEQLRQAIGELEFEWGGAVSCSFGVAQYAMGDSSDALVARADAALYRAKSLGRNRVELAQPPSSGALAAVA